MKAAGVRLGAMLLVLVFTVGCGATKVGTPSPANPVPPKGTATATIKSLPGGSMNLSAVAFPTPSEGWAGGNGVIVVTGDGGKTWKPVRVANFTVQSFFALDPLHGWAIGNTGLLTTTDGGQTWHPVGSSQTHYSSVSFVSDTVGFAIIGSGPGGSLSETTDGGKTWTALSGAAPSSAACFTDSTHGFSLSAPSSGSETLTMTTDGGATWKDSLALGQTGGMGGKLDCVGPQDVWAWIFGGAGMSQGSYSLFHTTDGGATWHAVAALSTAGGGPAPGNTAGAAQGPGVSPVAMSANGDAAYILAACYPCNQGTLTIGGTTDGGATWTTQPQSLPVPPGIGQFGLAFSTSTDGWLALSPTRGLSELLETQDGGVTWHVRYRSASTSPMGALDFISKTVGYGIGTPTDSAAVLETTDGGEIWRQVGELPKGQVFVASNGTLSFTTPLNGWAVAPSGDLVRTKNGGSTWTPVTVPALPAGQASGVAFTTVKDGCVSGYDSNGNMVFSTTDGGSSWPSQPVIGTDVLTCASTLAGNVSNLQAGFLAPYGSQTLVAFHGAKVAWVTAGGGPKVPNGGLLVTADGGKTWAVDAWPQGFNPQAYALLDGMTGWVSTYDGSLFRTTNGGRTWTQLP